MKKDRFFQTAFLIMVGIVASFAITCNGNGPAKCSAGASARTEGCNEFYVESTTVYKGKMSDANLPAFSGSGWNPLATNDAIRTNSTGEAQLNLKACWDGRLFVFRKSDYSLTVQECGKANYDEASNACLVNGAAVAAGCHSAYDLHTGSARVEILSTSYGVIYLPDNRDVTLVIALDGTTRVAPVISYDPITLGDGFDLEVGNFYFTMPDPPVPLSGLEPRQSYPLEELPVVVAELGIFDWAEDIRGKAAEYDVLPANWPPELGGQGEGVEIPPEPPIDKGVLVITSGGGVLNDSRARGALYLAIDWQAVTEMTGNNVTIEDESEQVASNLNYDPETSRMQFDESGIATQGLPVIIIFPAEDGQLEESAAIMGEYLSALGIDAIMEAIPTDELRTAMSMRVEAGESVLLLTR